MTNPTPSQQTPEWIRVSLVALALVGFGFALGFVAGKKYQEHIVPAIDAAKAYEREVVFGRRDALFDDE
jgi:hypothetical protein